MRKQHTFCPSLVESTLENRVVLSRTAGAAQIRVAAIAPRGDSDRILAQIRDDMIGQFDRAYADLARSLNQITDTTLLGGGASQIAAQRPTFDAQVQNAVGAMNAEIATLLLMSPLSQSRLAPAIQNSLVGSDPKSLLSRLQALPSPTDTDGASARAFRADVSRLLNQSLRVNVRRLDAFYDPNNPERRAISPKVSAMPPWALIHAQYVRVFQQMFSFFANNYVGAVGALFGSAGPSGNVTALAQNRPIFDFQVDGATQILNAQLTSVLSLLPRAKTRLIPQIQQRLFGNSADSLVNQLKTMATPTDLNGVSAQAFGTASSEAIGNAYSDVVGLLNDFFRRAGVNTSLQIPSSGQGAGGGQGGGGGQGTTASGSGGAAAGNLPTGSSVNGGGISGQRPTLN
ncbi:MAG: hypothetical protein IRY99_26570, partial [Isosphaeraceae bacterium]|nr:hypothetical protein [Isosphaeraceae bacterium]